MYARLPGGIPLHNIWFFQKKLPKSLRSPTHGARHRNRGPAPQPGESHEILAAIW